MGHPKGSKNKSGHKAGGDQKSKDAKKTNQPKNQPKIDWQRVPQKKKKQALQEQGVELQQAGQEEAALKQQAERLRHVFNHPSNKYGVPGYVHSAKTAHTSCDKESESDDKKFRPSYQPPSGSPIYHYLNEIKEEVTAGKHVDANWIPPRYDPLNKKNGVPKADDWYLSKVCTA